MNVPESFSLADLLHFFPSFVEVTAVDQKLGAKGLHRFILFRVVPFGYRNQAPDALDAEGQGNRLTVVPPCGGDNSPLAFLGSEVPQQIQTAPNLEGPGWIVILVLDVGFASQPPGDERVRSQRGWAEVPINRPASFKDAFEAHLRFQSCIHHHRQAPTCSCSRARHPLREASRE